LNSRGRCIFEISSDKLYNLSTRPAARRDYFKWEAYPRARVRLYLILRDTRRGFKGMVISRDVPSTNVPGTRGGLYEYACNVRVRTQRNCRTRQPHGVRVSPRRRLETETAQTPRRGDRLERSCTRLSFPFFVFFVLATDEAVWRPFRLRTRLFVFGLFAYTCVGKCLRRRG